MTESTTRSGDGLSVTTIGWAVRPVLLSSRPCSKTAPDASASTKTWKSPAVPSGSRTERLGGVVRAAASEPVWPTWASVTSEASSTASADSSTRSIQDAVPVTATPTLRTRQATLMVSPLRAAAGVLTASTIRSANGRVTWIGASAETLLPSPGPSGTSPSASVRI